MIKALSIVLGIILGLSSCIANASNCYKLRITNNARLQLEVQLNLTRIFQPKTLKIPKLTSKQICIIPQQVVFKVSALSQPLNIDRSGNIRCRRRWVRRELSNGVVKPTLKLFCAYTK